MLDECNPQLVFFKTLHEIYSRESANLTLLSH